MIKMWKKLSVVTALCISIFSFGMTSEAKEDEKIESGIYVNDINPCLAPSLDVIDFCHATRTKIDIDMYIFDSEEKQVE